MARCRRPSAGETPIEITLCESLTLRVWGRTAVSHAPDGSRRLATTALRLAVYQAAYWKPAKLRMPSCWNDSLLTSPSNDTKYTPAGSSCVSLTSETAGAAAAGVTAPVAADAARARAASVARSREPRIGGITTSDQATTEQPSRPLRS